MQHNIREPDYLRHWYSVWGNCGSLMLLPDVAAARKGWARKGKDNSKRKQGNSKRRTSSRRKNKSKRIRNATGPTRSFPCQVQKLGWETFGPKFRPPRGGEEEEKEKEKKKWPKATFFFLFLFLLLPPCGYLKKIFRTACSCPWSYHPPLQRRGLQRPKSEIRTLRVPFFSRDRAVRLFSCFLCFSFDCHPEGHWVQVHTVTAYPSYSDWDK